MDTTLIAVNFPEQGHAFQAFSLLRSGRIPGLDVRQAMVIERTADGRVQIADGTDEGVGDGAFTGGLIGTVIGILGGPLGMLLGLGAGALIGGSVDADQDDDAASALAELSRSIEPGATLLVAEVEESVSSTLDGEMAALGGRVTRRETEAVRAEIAAAGMAQEAARDEADRVLREQRLAERRERREARKHESELSHAS